MEKGGAIFPITFNDCGGIFPRRNFSGQKFSHSPPPPVGDSSQLEQGFVTVTSRVQARAHKAWATDAGQGRRSSGSRLPSAVMGEAAGHDLDVLNMKRLPTGRPPPPLRADPEAAIQALVPPATISFGQAARQENSSWLRAVLSKSNFRLDV